MAGYQGYSKSNNAVMAEEEGKFPLTKAIKELAKEAGITQKKARAILKELGPTEWHHTSKMYNRTDYYCTKSALLYMQLQPLKEELEAVDYQKLLRPCFKIQDFNEKSVALDKVYRELANTADCSRRDIERIYYNDYEIDDEEEC